jgi:hypothetical protein
MRSRQFDVLALIAFGVFAILTSLLTHATFVVAAILFLGLPSAYFLIRYKTKWRETTIAVFLFGILYCFLLDYVGELGEAWSWRPEQLLIQEKLFGVVSPDAILWTALWVLLLVLFYERMLERDRKDVVSSRVWVGFGIVALLYAIGFTVHYLPATSLPLGYAYLELGVPTLVPLLYVALRKRSLLPKFLCAALYFVPLYLSYELVGRTIGNWDFPGHYLFMIQVGSISFPFEEFFFWILCSSAVVLSGYELLIDDGK